ncbi:recombinase family protein [Flavobacterium tructae]|uniref:recombinase family protein n=1 Tax=Flavobacterium tructae TaxID=1114873 RepID=UPI002551FEE5|nr:recombinase family protein [Flavobacterium tructae]MDL2141799.1 recombinase family protein [Flavobacterium tructae]
MGKVAIYARVSTIEKQDYNRQISDCKNCIGNQYTENNIEIFAEQISGYKKNENKPQLSKLLEIIENDSNYFDAIYVTEISRLGRDPKETRELIDNLTEKRIPIFITSINRKTLDENGERDFVMNIVIQVLIEFSDSESKTMKKRSKSGLLQSVIYGNAGGSNNHPYGYTKSEDKKLVIDNEEALIIKEIFYLYKKGNGCKKIAGFMNEKNIPTRTNKAFGTKLMKFKTAKTADRVTWVDKTIDMIIKNPIYKGQRRFKGNLYPAPAIISEQLFDECNELMKTKTHRNYLTTYTYLLKDLLVCGCCGRNYFAKYKPVEGGDKVYICSSRLMKQGNCGNIGVNIFLLESAIYNELLSSELIVKYLADSNLKETLISKIRILESELNTRKTAFNKKESEKKKLLDLYLSSDNLTSDEYEQKKASINKSELELADKIELIKEEIYQNQKILSKQDDRKATIQMLIDAKGNRAELKVIFNQFISKIIINKLDAKMALASIFIEVNGVILPQPLKLILNIRGMILKPMKYQYLPFLNIESDPIYKNNILLVEVQDIINDIHFELTYQHWKTISEENILKIT